MKPKIIFEDDSLIVLDKPSGWIVNEAGTTGNTPVLQLWLKDNFDFPIVKSREYRSGIVHRLDKETSGILIVAKTLGVFKNLQAQFKERKVEKTYTALVHGKVEPEEGSINAPTGRLPWNRERFGVLLGGRSAITSYKVLNNYSQFTNHSKSQRLYRTGGQSLFTLVELYPKTGRTHQIRIHLKYLGHPVVSDESYAGRKTVRGDRIWCPRLFLHASHITFTHPTQSKKVSFTSELTQELNNALNYLEKLN